MSLLSSNGHLTAKLRFRTTAFSLLEAVVSLVVVIIIMAIAFPLIGNVRKEAANARCISNLQNFGKAIALYAVDHNGLIPPGRDYTDGTKYWFSSRDMWTYQYLGPNAPRNFRCPTDTYKSDYDRYYSYTWNVEFLQDWPVNVSARNPNAAHIYLRDALRKVMMADGTSNAERPPDNPNGSSFGSPGPVNPASAKTATTLSKRHNGGANCLMGDGSVQWNLSNDVLSPALFNHW